MAWDDEKVPNVSLVRATDWNAMVAFVKAHDSLDDLYPTVEVTGIQQAASPNTCYIANNPVRVAVTLPATAAVGQRVEIIGKGGGGWRLEQNANQYAILGSRISTVGTGGAIESTYAMDCIVLRCTTANIGWTVTSVIGNVSVI